jgi:hypothetical protein
VTELEKTIRALSSQPRALKLQPRWESIEQAIAFSKLALQVALEDHARWKKRRRDAEPERFRITAEYAEKAHQALQMLINHIGPSGLQGIEFPPVLISRNQEIKFRVRTGDFNHQKEGETLAAACAVTGEMHSFAMSVWETKKNEPDLAKRAFVYRLAEGWIFLTGKKPGGGRDTASNPFLRFVDAAACDAGEFKAGEDFYSSLTWVLKELARREAFDEKGETRQSISGIRTRGPAWLESTRPPAPNLGG